MGRQRNSTIVAIVCYNEGIKAARTLELVPPASNCDFDVVVIDDGSTDDTPSHIARFTFPVVRHPWNRGVGAAIKSGMRYALDHDYEILCILAGNAKDDPRQIPRVLQPIRDGVADYVQGSRFAPGGCEENTPIFRLAMIRLHARLLYALTGFCCSDSINGFRAYHTSLFKEGSPINVWQDWLDGYELETYLHFKVLSLGKRVTEVGVSKVYPVPQGRGRYSHIRPIRDWWKILRPIPLLMLRLRD